MIILNFIEYNMSTLKANLVLKQYKLNFRDKHIQFLSPQWQDKDFKGIFVKRAKPNFMEVHLKFHFQSLQNFFKDLPKQLYRWDKNILKRKRKFWLITINNPTSYSSPFLPLYIINLNINSKLDVFLNIV